VPIQDHEKELQSQKAAPEATAAKDTPSHEPLNSGQGASGGSYFSLVGGPRPMFGSVESRKVEAYTRQFKKFLKDAEINDIRVLGLDNSEFQLSYSVAVFVHHVSTNQPTVERLVVYPMLVEATGEKRSPNLTNINPEAISTVQNRVPEQLIVPADAMNEVMRNIILQQVKILYPKAEVVTLPGCVIPEWVDPTDPVHEKVMRTICQAGVNACYHTAIKLLQPTEINLAEEIKALQQPGPNRESRRFEYMLSFERGNITTSTGKPVRHSWALDLGIVSQGPKDYQFNVANTRSRALITFGYTDVIPTLETLSTAGAVPVQVTRFRPHVIMTLGHGVEVTSKILLHVASLVVMRDHWLQSIMPDKSDPLHDPGALNYLANLNNDPSGVGERLNFLDPSLNLSVYEVYQALGRLFLQGVVLSMDVEEFGCDTHYYNTFLVAAESNIMEKRQEATQSIINAANTLTNNAFSKRFNNQPIFSSVLRLPSGFWIDPNGNKRDLREFDMLNIINRFEKDIQSINQFASAYFSATAGNYPAVAKILETYKKMGETNITLTGWTTRLTFNGAFITALVEAINETGFGPTIKSPVSIQQGFGFQSVADFMSGAVVGPGTVGLGSAAQPGTVSGGYTSATVWY
jgi:hypothetical protein